MKESTKWKRRYSQKYLTKGGLYLISISKDESELIRNVFPEVHVRRTSQQKSQRHHYWMAEETAAMKYLADVRGTTVQKLTKY